MLVAIIIIAIIVVLIAVFISRSNALVRLKNNVKNAWAQVDVQLKQRADLIPNLVNIVKGYADFEKDTLTAVTNARANVLGLQGNPNATPEDKMKAEAKMTQAVSTFISTAEAYPELKANTNFQSLMTKLTDIEEKIGYARMMYNDTVLNYNTKLETFPDSFIASFKHMQPASYFNIDATDRAVPQVKF